VRRGERYRKPQANDFESSAYRAGSSPLVLAAPAIEPAAHLCASSADRKRTVPVEQIADGFAELGFERFSQKELPYLMAAAGKGVKLLWILASPCLYEHTPLVDIQAAHDFSRPLDSLSKSKRAAVMKAICQKIAEAAASGS
jgi:hypothetical protein